MQQLPEAPLPGAPRVPSCAQPEPGKGGRPRGPDPAHAAQVSPAVALPGSSPAAMDLGPVTICGEVTLLHGGFLRAATLCHPKPLSELAKSDWPKVGKSILDALEEICTSHSVYPPQPTMWKKKAIVVLWSKILLSGVSSPSTSTEQRWKDDVFFSVSQMIPEINHTVLFELLKAVNMPQLFAQLLLVLPKRICQRELETFVEYIATETSPVDVSFFLDVWWEIMKHKEGQEDRLTLLFRAVSHQHLSELEEMYQPPKKFKSSSTLSSPSSPLAADLLPVLMEGLKWIKERIGPIKMKCYALANLVDALSILVTAECELDMLPAHVYLDKISSVVTLWDRDCDNQFNQRELDEKVEEAERCMSLLNVNQLLDESLLAILGFLRSLLVEWSVELQALLSDPQKICYESYRLLDGLTSLQKNLANCPPPDEDTAQAMSGLGELIANFLKRINPKLMGQNYDSSLTALVAMVIIEKKMDRYLEICSIFASEKKWAFSKDWVSFLIKNKELFQKPELILQLMQTVSTFSTPLDTLEIQEQQATVSETILECYMELSLPDQNKVVLGVLSTWGRQGLSRISKIYSEWFQDDLNLTFNQIFQSDSGEGFKKAVAAVSPLVVLNPEATIKKICNLAVANLGTHQFLAEILCSFPALRFQEYQDNMDESINLVLGCLKETVWEKLSSPKEKEQLLEFIMYLMQPSGASPLLSPAEVTKTLVLPFLKADDPHVELCLQILEKVLQVSVPLDQNWVHSCHPFPLTFCLCKLLDGFTQYWHELNDQHNYPLQTKDLVTTTLAQLCNTMLAQKDSVSPELWNQSVAWLHKKVGTLDWTIGLRLKDIYGEHFKNEVPATLFEVCQLPENEWTTRPLPSYGAGTGLLAWMECCCISAALREQMLVLLVVNVDNPEEVSLFSKGFLVALIQVLPWCSQSEWKRLSHVVRNLLEREVLYIPYSLEYIQYLPLLNFRPFAYHLQFSVLLLRAFQFLCSSSGATWLSDETWKHVVRLYCLSLSDLLSSVKNVAHCQWHPADEKDMTKEISFVYIQMFCHTLHVSAMLPDDGISEPLVVLALEILSQYEMLYEADESLGSTLRKANEKHFLESISENVTNKRLRTMLFQKLSKL